MGGIVSKIRFVLQLIDSTLDEYHALSKRIESSPGIPKFPVPTQAGNFSSNTSTPPYWTIPASPIAREGETTALPVDTVDVVIIGSGVTGTAIAKALLEYSKGRSADAEVRGEKITGKEITVVMLEARDACSGSTGRNGGHIGPIVYNEYGELKSAYGASMAEEILRFRLAHVSRLISTAQAEGLLSASQAREVESFDVYGHPKNFTQAKEELHEFFTEAPADLTKGFGVVEDRQGIEKLQLVPSVVGCVSRPGGAIHPYRFVTGILSKLLSRYSSFQLFTHTPCTAITSASSGYVVRTSRGDIRTAHVIHATNAWSSHLLPGMRGKIIPTRTSMTAQRSGKGLSKSWAGNRAFVFYPIENTSVFEYLTQLLPAPISDDRGTEAALPTAGEFMFGGRMQPSFTKNIGIADDRSRIFENEAHLAGALERFFAVHWGSEGEDEDEDAAGDDGRPGDSSEEQDQGWGKGRVRAAWSGLLGMSADLQPWVGRVPYTASGRTEPTHLMQPLATATADCGLAPSGEWICAGYTGEGMVHAWLSGRALARMVLDLPEGPDRNKEEPRLPQPFLITEKRLKETRYEDTIRQW